MIYLICDNDARVPGTDKGGYFESNANFAGFEHRAVMQVPSISLLKDNFLC